MNSKMGMRAPGLRGAVSLAALACALSASQAAWGQEATLPPSAASSSNQTTPPKSKPASSPTGADQSSAASEVVVTGTNIKGVKPIAPVITITRQNIEESGYSTVGDVMRSLPEDFGGGQNPGTFAATASGINNQNVSNGSSVNLFGLGSDATLTLLNGHRMPSDGFYEAPDISVIPLGAIQRVEVVTDGSSAIYGSDAVAGVVNFILRKDYNGLEGTAYYGGATEGGDETQIYSILGGVVRDRWHVLVSAEYEHEDPITASERDFTSGAYGLTTLIESQTRNTVFLSGGVDLTDRLSFSIDGLYNNRESGAFLDPTGSYTEETQFVTPNANVAATLDFRLSRDWDISLIGTEAVSSTAETYQEAAGVNLIKGAETFHNNVRSLEIAANGKVITLPTGDLRMAFGGGYREEGFKKDFPGFPAQDINVIRASRDVAYAYGEALIPLVPLSVRRLGFEELDLSASGRYEHYSDFGDTANPKVGLRYVPFGGLTLRATWGTSFKAPSFLQMYQGDEVTYIKDYYGGAGNVLEPSGGNPNLKPETSKEWTIGAEFSPTNLKTMLISITYFNISYKDRIVNPLNTSNSADFVVNPADAPFVTADPSAAVDQSLIAKATTFLNVVGSAYNPSTVDYILNDTYQNAEAQVDTGVDLSYRENFNFGFGSVRTFASMTWNHLTQQLVPGESVETLSGTAFNVPNFKARGGASWSKFGLTATAIVNFTSKETDTLIVPHTSVGSWTTVDANLAYKFPDGKGFQRGLSFTLSATNLFNRPPPFASTDGAYRGVNFDSLNGSPIGRFVAIKATKKW